MNMARATTLALSAAALIVGGCAKKAGDEDARSAEAARKVKCLGVNECKGQGACGTGTHTCAGQNECKGKGWIVIPRAECEQKGGKVI